jgi:hypothetical protein
VEFAMLDLLYLTLVLAAFGAFALLTHGLGRS